MSETTNKPNNEISFKIGMVAPTGVGKTSLLTAICDEVQQRVAEQPLEFWPKGERTQAAMSRARAEFHSAMNTSDNLFTVPKLKPTSDITEFEYAVSMLPSKDESGTLKIAFDILDYPGSLLGTDEFAEKVTPHLRDSVALLVPISADILMDWYNTKDLNDTRNKQRNAVANMMLDVDNVLLAIRNWFGEKVRRNQKAQLYFVPVKCEKCFDDNGGRFNMVAKLHDAVCERYVNSLELNEDQRRLIQINVFYIDTYGVVELRDIDMKDGEMLVSTFQRRTNMGKNLRTMNAYELLMNILKFQMEDKLHSAKDQRVIYNDKLINTGTKVETTTVQLGNTCEAKDIRVNNYTLGEKIWFYFVPDKTLEEFDKKIKNLQAQIQAGKETQAKLQGLLAQNKQNCDRYEEAIKLLTSLINDMPNRQEKVYV